MEITRNVRGFMHPLNEISQAFIDFAVQAPGLAVDIGAAYGVATIPILEKHINVVACDVEQSHLDEIVKRLNPELLAYLKLKQGHFPKDIDFEKGSVGAVLLSHVLPFLSPEELDYALDKLYGWLTPKGKIFIVSYTPYINPMKTFLPVYEANVLKGANWPCWINNNIRDYFVGPQEIAAHLPDTINYLDLTPLINGLEKAGFSIEIAKYLDPAKNHIPRGVLLDGREWCGVIAVKK
ncbi:MAG: class I SAM-dependent methyltransferase [Coxiellaceae bacterium]|nr:MAG: class I SAM-dependent methyltransferase [Coxiellaceae bacterium]